MLKRKIKKEKVAVTTSSGVEKNLGSGSEFWAVTGGSYVQLQSDKDDPGRKKVSI